MALAMARPWKHPKTGVYWLRKRVPDDLRVVLGKLELLQSLKTKDPGEAKLRHAEALVAVETQWANLRAGPKTLTERGAHELAAPLFDWWLALLLHCDVLNSGPSSRPRQHLWGTWPASPKTLPHIPPSSRSAV